MAFRFRRHRSSSDEFEYLLRRVSPLHHRSVLHWNRVLLWLVVIVFIRRSRYEFETDSDDDSMEADGIGRRAESLDPMLALAAAEARVRERQRDQDQAAREAIAAARRDNYELATCPVWPGLLGLDDGMLNDIAANLPPLALGRLARTCWRTALWLSQMRHMPVAMLPQPEWSTNPGFMVRDARPGSLIVRGGRDERYRVTARRGESCCAADRPFCAKRRRACCARRERLLVMRQL